MSVKESPNPGSSGIIIRPVLPTCRQELKPFLESADSLMGLISDIQREQGGKSRWAERQPVCARDLVQTLFSKRKFDQAVVPFFSVCDNDAGLRKALVRIASHAPKDPTSAEIQGTLEEKIQAIAEHPNLFFELGNESLNHQNRRLVQALFSYCDKNPEFVQKNLKDFSKLVKRVVHLEDLVVLEYILEHGIDRFLEKKHWGPSNDGDLDLSAILIYKRWNVLDLLIQKGRVRTMWLSSYMIQKGEDPEKIDLLLANGAVVDKPYSSLYEYENEEKRREKRAYARHEVYNALHAENLTIEYLKSLKGEDLWWWLSFDVNAASVLAKHPQFFIDLLSQQSDHPPYFERAIKVYTAAGIIDPVGQGVPLLFRAIFSNNESMAMALIGQGVPANAIDAQNGWTVFEAALRSLKPDGKGQQLFEYLLNQPVTNVGAPFKDGVHPIDALFQLNIPDKMTPLKVMLKKGLTLHGAKLTLLERAGALHPYDVPVLKLLISHGIFLGEHTPDKDTVLHVLISSCAASSDAHREACLQLITHLATNAPKTFDGVINNQGKTVLDLAKEKDLPEVLLILLQAGITKRTDSYIPGFNQQSIMEAYRKPDCPNSPSELRPWLNLTNLSYLFGDAIVKYGVSKSGKPSDNRVGNSFPTSGTFLTVLLTACEKVWTSRNGVTGEVQALAQARQKLEQAVFCSRVLELCKLDEGFKRRYLPILSATIEAQIAALPAGETLLIPSGWEGLEGKYHAMLLEVGKNQDGTCSLIAINTDKQSGALLHTQRPTGLKGLINPIRAFNRIPQEKLFDSSLIPSLLSLLAHIPEDGANQYGADDYYHLLFSHLKDYATPLPPDQKMRFITAQRSGTCTIRCALAYLYVFLGEQLYKKVKTELEAITFQAINDPEFLEKSAVNPEFLQHLEHAIERTALHVNKHKGDSPTGLGQAEEVARLLSDVERRMEVVVESSQPPDLVKSGVVVAKPLLEQAVTKLQESRQKLFHPKVHAEPLAPFQPLAPPVIDFSKLATGQEWMTAIDQLNGFFEQSFQNPLDPHQTIAARLTTQAVSTLALPNKGVFHPGIDEQTAIGSLSAGEKKLLKQKLENLCRKYATAMYEQRSAAADREVMRSGLWYGDHEEPYSEAQSIEQYLCINKLFAHYWRLSLALEGQTPEPHFLCRYGIDISHLKALKNSIHLPCYDQRVAEQMDQLIVFFEQSHPAPNAPNRSLLAIGSWSKNGMTVELPISDHGEELLCGERYEEIPEKVWLYIDREMETIKGWTKPDKKKFRMAHLFVHPERYGLELYSDLRKIAFTCWLFKTASHQAPVEFEGVKWSEEQHVLETKFIVKSRVKNLERRVGECRNPSLVGKLGYSLHEEALQSSLEQNEYMIRESSRGQYNSRRYYEIAQAEEFAIQRLLCHYQDNISDLNHWRDQEFFQIVLFGKERLAQAVRQDPAIGNRILRLIEQALHEFTLELQANPAKTDLLRGIIFLNTIKLRLGSYLPDSFPERERSQLQHEIVQNLEKNSHMKVANKAELLLLWICAQPASSWADFKSCEQALVYLGQFELCVERRGPDEGIDQTLRSFAYQTIFAHLDELKAACAHPKVLAEAARQIIGAYGIAIEQETVIQGTFPQVWFFQNERLYEINLLSGVVIRDKIPLVNPSRILMNPTIVEFSRKRKEPIELYDLERSADLVRFYSRSGGFEYHYIVHPEGKNWGTQIEWQRGKETFCYIPFDEVPDGFKRIALENSPKRDNYYYWVSKGPSDIAGIIQNRATGVEEVVIYADGTAEKPSSKKRWNYLPVESVPELAALASMLPKEQIAVWQIAGPSDVREVRCFGLKDCNGVALTLQDGRKPGFLEAVNLPGYRFSGVQTVKGLGRHFPYAIVENAKGRRKALVPVKIWSEATGDSNDLDRIYSYEEIAIDKKGYPSPSGIKEQLLLAYYFIGAKQYSRALGLLKNIDGSRAYSPDEFRMLGWIFLHSEQTNDHSPKAVALALMAARLAKVNLDNFPDAHSQDPLNPKVTGYYAEPKVWVQFWKGAAVWEEKPGESKSLHAFLGETFERYYEVSSHCTSEFQIHGKQLTRFQEAQWLSQILISQILAHGNYPGLEHRLSFPSYWTARCRY